MSLTLQLLRMDAEDVWTRHRQRRQHNAASAAATGGLGGGFGGGHYNGQSPVGETLRHHLTSEGTSLSTKVHTVILSGNIPQWSLGPH